MSNAFPRPQCESQAILQIEKSNRSIFDFFANDSLRWQAKTLVVEFK
jgi:hypothetical protein